MSDSRDITLMEVENWLDILVSRLLSVLHDIGEIAAALDGVSPVPVSDDPTFTEGLGAVNRLAQHIDRGHSAVDVIQDYLYRIRKTLSVSGAPSADMLETSPEVSPPARGRV